MKIIKTIADLNIVLNQLQATNERLGFIPTMGALHEGHLSLILEAQQTNSKTMVSIYVNPTQFNDPDDLEKYPRPIEQDIKALQHLNCDYLFLPSTSEIYPKNLVTPKFDLNGLDRFMEGAHRPGHFDGVIQIVYRLLDLITPQQLYMGQKDFQQYSIISHMIQKLDLDVELVRVPIVREPDGLAMSSRNVRLSPEGRALAPNLYRILQAAKFQYEQTPTVDPRKLETDAISALGEKGIMEVDYFSCVDGYSLQPVLQFSETDYVVICATIRIDGIRLLDNIILKEEKDLFYQKEQAEKQLIKDRIKFLNANKNMGKKLI